MRILVVNHITLDGVIQAPGRPDEDTRGGFRHGGWAASRSDDPALQQAVAQRLGTPGRSWLFGHRTYDILLASWNEKGGPYKDTLNDAPKYVVSSDAATELAWPNSTLLHGDVSREVADLKQRSPGDLVIMGSAELVRSLLPHGLIDELFLMIHPLVLGSGVRLFEASDDVTALRLDECTATTQGVLLSSYAPSAAAAR